MPRMHVQCTSCVPSGCVHYAPNKQVCCLPNGCSALATRQWACVARSVGTCSASAVRRQHLWCFYGADSARSALMVQAASRHARIFVLNEISFITITKTILKMDIHQCYSIAIFQCKSIYRCFLPEIRKRDRG